VGLYWTDDVKVNVCYLGGKWRLCIMLFGLWGGVL